MSQESRKARAVGPQRVGLAVADRVLVAGPGAGDHEPGRGRVRRGFPGRPPGGRDQGGGCDDRGNDDRFHRGHPPTHAQRGHDGRVTASSQSVASEHAARDRRVPELVRAAGAGRRADRDRATRSASARARPGTPCSGSGPRDEVDEVLAEVRALLRERGRAATQWEVGSSARRRASSTCCSSAGSSGTGTRSRSRSC